MADDMEGRLRDLLKERIASAAQDALRSGGDVPAKHVAAAARLARLLDIYIKATPRPHRRGPLVLALGVTFLIVSALIALRVAETEIELDAAVSEVGFAFPVGQKLTEAIALSSLGVTGLREMEIPRSRDRDGRQLQFGEETGSGLRLAIAGDPERRGSIHLEPLILPAATRIWVRHTGPRAQYRVSMTGAAVRLNAGVSGPVDVAVAVRGMDRLDFAAPRAFFLHGGPAQIDLDLAFLDPSASALSPQLDANQLSLLRVDETRDAGRTVVRHVSTIRSGTLYLESLNSQAHTLRASEVLQFEHAAGEIRLLALQPDSIELKFRGRVRGMTIGSGDGQRSLMPTWLEWLKERHGLSLFWGTALYLFGLIGAVFRWLGKPL